jgi:hypothetical protein
MNGSLAQLIEAMAWYGFNGDMSSFGLFHNCGDIGCFPLTLGQ